MVVRPLSRVISAPSQNVREVATQLRAYSGTLEGLITSDTKISTIRDHDMESTFDTKSSTIRLTKMCVKCEEG